MAYGRHGVLSGQTINLRIVLTDDTGMMVSADTVPDVYIYDESVDIETLEAELAARTFTSAFAGPLTPTEINTGFYELAYTVPSGADEGTWHDVWVADVDGVVADGYQAFEVEVGAVQTTQVLLNNELIIIELDSSIANTDGSLLLAEDTQIAFSTVYTPFYASPDLLRLEGGPFLSYIPDDTLALMIHWASKEADFIAKPARCNAKDFAFARTKFVLYDAAVKALMLPGGYDAAGRGGDGARKSLGDLAIDRREAGGSTVATISSGIDLETFREFKGLRDAWWKVTNAGGCLVPGQSIAPTWGIKGRFDENRRGSGRLWRNPQYEYYAQPTVNSKIRYSTKHRSRFFFDRWQQLRGVGYGW